MTDIVFTLVAIAASFGIPAPKHSEARLIIDAAIAACPDDDCAVDSVFYAIKESSLRMRPPPESWDAKRGLATGPWQLWNAPAGLMAQARAWVALRAESLKRWGDLRGLAGATPAGVRLTRAREAEREDCLFAAAWAVTR